MVRFIAGSILLCNPSGRFYPFPVLDASCSGCSGLRICNSAPAFGGRAVLGAMGFRKRRRGCFALRNIYSAEQSIYFLCVTDAGISMLERQMGAE
jgi:hypothetical protein